LEELAIDFADALKSIDADKRSHKQFAPGVGPYGEADAVRAALSKLRIAKALPLNKCFKSTPTVQYSQWFMRRIWITYLPTDPKPVVYADAAIKRLPDLLIPGQWAVEYKIVRPFGNNGQPAEHWSENILHPYVGNTSSLGDCLRLLSSGLTERKAVIIFGYEHTPPKVSLDAAITGFELLAKEVVGLRLSDRAEQLRNGLIHEVHQQLRVFAYEVLGTQDN